MLLQCQLLLVQAMAGQALELQQAKAATAQLELDKAQLEVQASQVLRTEAQHAQRANGLDVTYSSTGMIESHHQPDSQVRP